MARRRQEDTDIDQNLYPKLEELGIPRQHIRRNIATNASGQKRGDLWLSEAEHTSADFEKHIIGLVEAKDHSTSLDDVDWLDAKRQGQEKARAEGLRAFFVTNTESLTRCYNTETLDEVSIDGVTINELHPLPVLKAVQTQVNPNNSDVALESFSGGAPNPKTFRSALWKLRQIYRSKGLSKGNEDAMDSSGPRGLDSQPLVLECVQAPAATAAVPELWTAGRNGRFVAS